MSVTASASVVPSGTIELGSGEAYRLLAEEYDKQLNPLLVLEARIIASLTPSLVGKAVLDLGCGTGRWLARLAGQKPSALFGIDSSPEMIRVAKSKMGGAFTLSVAGATDLPLLDGSIDFVISSFLASYIQDLGAFARELRRVCRPEATVLLTDIHPDTVCKLGWRRAFRSGNEKIVIQTCSHSREGLIDAFRAAGFEAELVVDPSFAAPERAIFETAGKLQEFGRALGEPAILVLGFKAAEAPRSLISLKGPNTLRLVGADVALDAFTSVTADLQITNGHVETILSNTAEAPTIYSQACVDLSGYLLLPGLINAHDHLEFALFPRLGNRRYESAREWALDIHHPESEPISSLRSIDKSVRLWWGGIRNLLSGVTTVCHHNDYAPVFDEHFPVRVLRRYGWAHSLAFEADIENRVRSLPENDPFFVHLGEGTSSECEAELWELDRQGLLDSRTVIVHALAIGERGLDLVRKRGASIVWCPSSNLFLFGKALEQRLVEACPSIALGSDSPLTCTGDLLDEIRTAHQEIGISDLKVYEQVTNSAASILRLNDGEGCVRPGAIADLIAIPHTGKSPAETIVQATYREVEMVIVGGRLKLASSRTKALFSEADVQHLSAINVEGTERWIDAPVEELLAATTAVLGPDIRLGGKRVGHA